MSSAKLLSWIVGSFAILWICPIVFAAPYPGAGSSALMDPEKQLSWQKHGFALDLKDSPWMMSNSTQVNEKEFNLSLLMDPKMQRKNSKLSLRIEEIKPKQDLNALTKKWIREYPILGFQWLQTKEATVKGQKAIVVDFYQKTKGIQLRQVLMRDGQRLAVFTCSDRRETFVQTLSQCNAVVQSFQWK